MTARPTKLSRVGNDLVIDWSDGQRHRYEIADLRRNCPCAGCRGHHGIPPHPEVLASIPDNIRLDEIHPVGNYAYKIVFSDGHDTGIFTLELLRQLGRDE